MTSNPRWRSAASPGLPVLVAFVLVVVAAPVPAGQVATAGDSEQVTFTKHIAPILQRSCQNCHRPDSVAPMSLLTYEDARPWAKSMKFRTGLRTKPNAMPPWYIEKNVGIQQYKGDISLSDEEIAKIAKWADTGAPQGNPADMPPPLKFVGASEWQMGKPDLILSSPTVEVKATSPDWWGPIGETPTGLTEDRYVAAIEMKEVNDGERKSDRQTIGGLYVFHHLIWAVIGGGDQGRPTLRGGRFTKSDEMPTSSIPTPADFSRPARNWSSPPPISTRPARRQRAMSSSASSSIRRGISRRRRSRVWTSPPLSTSISRGCRPTSGSKPTPR